MCFETLSRQRLMFDSSRTVVSLSIIGGIADVSRCSLGLAMGLAFDCFAWALLAKAEFAAPLTVLGGAYAPEF